MAEYTMNNIIVLGDFNLVPDPGMDRLTTEGPYHSYCKHPYTRAYTCNSESYKTFSRIDLAFVGVGSVLPRVTEATILPKGLDMLGGPLNGL